MSNKISRLQLGDIINYNEHVTCKELNAPKNMESFKLLSTPFYKCAPISELPSNVY